MVIVFAVVSHVIPVVDRNTAIGLSHVVIPQGGEVEYLPRIHCHCVFMNFGKVRVCLQVW